MQRSNADARYTGVVNTDPPNTCCSRTRTSSSLCRAGRQVKATQLHVLTVCFLIGVLLSVKLQLWFKPLAINLQRGWTKYEIWQHLGTVLEVTACQLQVDKDQQTPAFPVGLLSVSNLKICFISAQFCCLSLGYIGTLHVTQSVRVVKLLMLFVPIWQGRLTQKRRNVFWITF